MNESNFGILHSNTRLKCLYWSSIKTHLASDTKFNMKTMIQYFFWFYEFGYFSPAPYLTSLHKQRRVLQNLEKMMYDVGGKYKNHETNTLSKSVSIEWNWISWCSDPNRYMKFCNHSFLLPSLSWSKNDYKYWFNF